MGKVTDGRKNNGNKGHSTKTKRIGRPKLELCEDDLFKLAQNGMTDQEICDLLDISQSVLQSFRGILKKGRSVLNKSIKRTQLEVGINERNPTMLIWLGKQYAGQREKIDQDSHNRLECVNVMTYSDKKPVTWKEEQKPKEER